MGSAGGRTAPPSSPPQGVLIDRSDDDPIFLPAGSLTAVGTAPGIAGKVMGLPHGVLIVTWRLGDVQLDSGFRADDPALQADWIDAAQKLINRPAVDGGAQTSNGAPA